MIYRAGHATETLHLCWSVMNQVTFQQSKAQSALNRQTTRTPSVCPLTGLPAGIALQMHAATGVTKQWPLVCRTTLAARQCIRVIITPSTLQPQVTYRGHRTMKRGLSALSFSPTAFWKILNASDTVSVSFSRGTTMLWMAVFSLLGICKRQSMVSICRCSLPTPCDAR